MHRGEMWCSFPRISDRQIQGNIPDPCVVLLHYPDIQFHVLGDVPHGTISTAEHMNGK